MTNYFNAWESHLTQHRPYLLAFAFRMTGSLAEAEDIVQDAFLECVEVDPASITSHKSWLTKVCSNKGLDHIKRAYKKRETYVGPWLPDALPEGFDYWGEALEKLQERESLTTSFLLLMERLNPEERVIYLLNEILDYSFQEIAQFLQKSEAACRKTAQRAREALANFKIKNSFPQQEAYQVLNRFFDFAKTGDVTEMEKLLSRQSQMWGDGGGKVSAASRVIERPDHIANLFRNLGKIFSMPGVKLEFRDVNMRPGLVVSRQLENGEWTLDTVMSFDVGDEGIERIYAQRNPDKLANIAQDLIH